MMQGKLSTSSGNFKAIGAGKVLAYLRGDIQKARKSLFVIGPWIDGYFVKEIIALLRKDISIRFLIRFGDTEDEKARIATLASLNAVRSHVASFEIRSLPTLHAKVIIVDNDIAYVGSTNWYRYSLEQSLEVTLRGSVSSMADLQDILDRYWEEAEQINLNEVEIISQDKLPEINHEILDPLARKVLEENPKAFVKRIKKE
ncbi:Cardiolipin synthase A [uncultured archaeon]|nr:Cardiolipin synthase A [uncultured archaeon]